MFSALEVSHENVLGPYINPHLTLNLRINKVATVLEKNVADLSSFNGNSNVLTDAVGEKR